MMSSTMVSSTVAASTSDATTMLNNQLASALSTLGDAQFWEETISPATIRNELSASDPSNPNSTPIMQKGMKWLLASISKGRDVSDFYPHVVKLVGATSLEVRKMVYMYLVQYADHDPTTRELSLLSINSFQRGLADSEQLIRALALRVLSSIRIADILQIQILGVQKCAKDRSPYVRKCAANALAKLNPRCDVMQREMLLDIMKLLLDTDTSTMVLSSALIAFIELCPERLDLLHGSFRKICHLLTDMDEWGQVVIIDLLARYCRQFFKEPRGWKSGTAEKIDRERRVRRKVEGIENDANTAMTGNGKPAKDSSNLLGIGNVEKSSPSKGFSDSAAPRKIKRRVVQKGFYSDEEDTSTEEEVYAESVTAPAISTASAMRQRNILGLPGMAQPIAVNMEAEEDLDLDEDHKLLLESSRPLLKSRNSGVVLSVCSLLYYCGASSVKNRSAIGKALVRIHRDRREIQYVVLTSIRSLVNDCPSAFAPFLNDFYVKALDPPHTRMIKIDILVSLALEPAAIEAVLRELRTYIRNGDKAFACAAIRAVGRVAELARIVYDRHGVKSGDATKERKTANRIALDCLYGLAVITQVSDSKAVVGESICIMQNIMTMLASDAGEEGSLFNVEDPNNVQRFAIRRILLLLVRNLSGRVVDDDGDDDDDDDDLVEKEPTSLERVTIKLPARATASALWLIGEWLSGAQTSLGVSLRTVDEAKKSKIRLEILRLVDRAFLELDVMEKEQGIHYASKVLVYGTTAVTPSASNEIATCEHILSMGRLDVNPDVKDRARFESSIVHATVGLKHDTECLEILPSFGNSLNVDSAKTILLKKKPASSFLPVTDENAENTISFRFGTLSSLVGHQARKAYVALPPWSENNSPKALRDPVEAAKALQTATSSAATEQSGGGGGGGGGGSSGFYASDSSDSDDDSSSDSSSSSDDDASDDDSSSSSSSDDDDDDDGGAAGRQKQTQNTVPPMMMNQGAMPMMTQPAQQMGGLSMGQNLLGSTSRALAGDNQSSSDDDDSSSSSSSSSDESYNGDVSSANVLTTPGEGNLLGFGANLAPTPGGAGVGAAVPRPSTDSSAIDDLKGLVLAPVAFQDDDATSAFHNTNNGNPNIERDSSDWIQLVRPELSGGLSVIGRYLRGATKSREVQLKGLNPRSPSVICVQVKFGNKKSDTTSIRRIRILPRSGPTGGGKTSIKKMICPPEIGELKTGQMSNATICIEFGSISDREGDMVARVDIKSSTGGSMPVELKPSLGELLQPLACTKAEYETTMDRMQGFQRIVSSFQSTILLPTSSSSSSSKNEILSSLSTKVLKCAALTPVGKSTFSTKDNQLRLVGGLPTSNEIVLVLIQVTNMDNNNNGDGNSSSTTTTSGGPAVIVSGTITVCCDHAVAVNSILNVMKRTLND